MIKLLGFWKKERRNKEIKKGAVRKSPTVKVTAIKHNLIKKKIVKQCLRVLFFGYDDWSRSVIKWNDWSLSLLSSSNVIQINRQATIKHNLIKKEILFVIDLSFFKTRWMIPFLLIKLKCNPNRLAGKCNLHFTFDGCSSWIRIVTWDQMMSQTQNTGTFWFIGQIWRSRGGTDTDIPWRLKSAKGGSDWGCKFLGTPKLDLTLYGCIKRSNMG